jgi:hypothetical protein
MVQGLVYAEGWCGVGSEGECMGAAESHMGCTHGGAHQPQQSMSHQPTLGATLKVTLQLPAPACVKTRGKERRGDLRKVLGWVGASSTPG